MDVFVGHISVAVRKSDSQSREPGFESSHCRFDAWAISFTRRCLSSLSFINKYLAKDSGGQVKECWNEQFLVKVSLFERSYGLDTALYKNVPLLFTITEHILIYIAQCPTLPNTTHQYQEVPDSTRKYPTVPNST